MSDPHLAAVAAFAEQVWRDVADEKLDGYTALALLASDTLAMSQQDSVNPDVADVLLAMASEWSLKRYGALNAAAALAADPIPDDPSGIEAAGEH